MQRSSARRVTFSDASRSSYPQVQAPVVSVVVSTFNRASQLRGAIDRLVAQHTRVPYEVIVIDNNSTDETPRVLEELGLQHRALVRHRFESRQGVSYGRNSGIEVSRAPIVAFTDDDVQVTLDWVERITAAMKAHPHVDCVGGRVLPIWTKAPPSWVTKRHWSPLALVDYGDQPFYVDHTRPLCLLTANVAYRRAALDEIGWFSPDFPRCQDHELLLRLWDSGRRGLYLPSLVVTCEVPASRLRWSYHRRWHSEHGRFCAQMRDGIDAPHGGREQALTLFGAPASVYRALASSVRDYMAGLVLCRPGARRTAEAAIRHRLAFLAGRAHLWRKQDRGVLQEIVHFLSGWREKRRLQTGQVAPRG